MSTYHPDKWAIVELITPKETLYKVMASWYGGFATGDSWKMNSGIKSVVETEHTYEYLGYSGSTYVCHKQTYGLSMYAHSVLLSYIDQVKEKPGFTLRLLDEEEVKGLKFNENNIS